MSATDGFGDVVNSSLNFAIQIILTIGTVLAVLILLVTATADLRDRALEAGFLGGLNGRLGKGYRRRRIAGLIPYLEAVGLEEEARRAIREATSKRRRSVRPIARPDQDFLDRASSWVRELDPPFTYNGTPYYLDLMGAINGRTDYERGIDQVFEAWVTRLKNEGVLASPDVIIAPKDGNVLLSRQLAQQLGVPLVLCKGERDKSRIKGPEETEEHESDFEGLRAFCDREMEENPGSQGRKYQALLVDDSCRNGGQLQSAAVRFNKLFALGESALQLPFSPLETAVVLFRSLAGDVSDEGLNRVGLRLHALVAVGEKELGELAKRKTSKKNAAEYKRNSSCEQSRMLFDNADKDGAGSRRRASRTRLLNFFRS